MIKLSCSVQLQWVTDWWDSNRNKLSKGVWDILHLWEKLVNWYFKISLFRTWNPSPEVSHCLTTLKLDANNIGFIKPLGSQFQTRSTDPCIDHIALWTFMLILVSKFFLFFTLRFLNFLLIPIGHSFFFSWSGSMVFVMPMYKVEEVCFSSAYQHCFFS